MRKNIIYLLLFIAWLSISLSSIIIILSGANALQAAFWRLFFSVLLLCGYEILVNRRMRLGFTIYSLVAGVLLGLHFLTWMKSLFLIPVSLSTTLVVMYPAITALLDHIVLKEKIDVRQVIGLLTAFIGIVIMLNPGFQMNNQYLYGSLLALSGAFFAAGYFFIGRITRLEGNSVTEYTIPTYSIASITILLIGLTTDSFFTIFPPKTWCYLLLLAIIPMIGGHTVMNYLLKHMKTYGVTSIALGEPVGATILAYIFLSQTISPRIILGMSIVLTGLFLVIIEKGKQQSLLASTEII